jgi:hypothetical protein
LYKVLTHINVLIGVSFCYSEIDYHIDYFGEENREQEELFLSNHKKHWLIYTVGCSVVNTKDTCSIDLEEYDELIKTKCGHLFCDKNLYSWLNEHDNKTCPLCRTKLW